MKKLILFVTIVCLAFGTTMAFAEKAEKVDRKKCAQDHRSDIKDCQSIFSTSVEVCNDDAMEYIEEECLDLDKGKDMRKCIKGAIKVKKDCKKDAIAAKKACFSDAIEEKKLCLSGE